MDKKNDCKRDEENESKKREGEAIVDKCADSKQPPALYPSLALASNIRSKHAVAI